MVEIPNTDQLVFQWDEDESVDPLSYHDELDSTYLPQSTTPPQSRGA